MHPRIIHGIVYTDHDIRHVLVFNRRAHYDAPHARRQHRGQEGACFEDTVTCEHDLEEEPRRRRGGDEEETRRRRGEGECGEGERRGRVRGLSCAPSLLYSTPQHMRSNRDSNTATQQHMQEHRQQRTTRYM